MSFQLRREEVLDDVETGAKTGQDIEHAQVGVGLDGETHQVRRLFHQAATYRALIWNRQPSACPSRRFIHVGVVGELH